MADTYIDDDETRLYGDYAIEQMGLQVVGRLREFDPALQYAMSALRAATDAVAGHLYVARSADPALHRAIAQREHAIAEARQCLQRFSRHLESHRPGTVPYGAFFVEPCDTLSRRGPWRLLAALDHVLGSLAELGGPVRDASHWQSELAHASPAASDRRRTTSWATANKLAKNLGIDKAAISRATNRLVELGLITSERDPDHAARNILTLTETGEEHCRLIGHFTFARENHLLNVLDDEEHRQFLMSLRKILTNVESVNKLVAQGHFWEE